MTTLTRRDVLAGSGTALAGLAVAGTASADHLPADSPSIAIDYPESVLNRYRPGLVTYHLDFEPTLYGWRATSADRDTDALVYWAEYPAQDGAVHLPGTSLSDSHIGDHEPFYAFVDSETGEPVEYRASVYHWGAGTFYPNSLTYDAQRPRFKPVSPWHQYTMTSETPQEDYPVKNLGHPFEIWLKDSGFHEALEPGVVTNPWRMRSRGYWWRDSIGGFSWDAFLVNRYATLSKLPFTDYGGWANSATDRLNL